MKTCAACNLEYSEDDRRYCDSCGKLLATSDELVASAQPAAQPTQQQAAEVGLMVAGAVAVGVIGLSWLFKAVAGAAKKTQPPFPVTTSESVNASIDAALKRQEAMTSAQRDYHHVTTFLPGGKNTTNHWG